MKNSGYFALFLLLFFSITGCSPPATSETNTATPPPLPTDTPVPIPTSTSTAEPTALPGVETIPLDEFKIGVPWLDLDEANQPMTIFYGFNMKEPPFDDILVRKAFAAAIDREKVAQAASEYYFRETMPATTMTHPLALGRNLYGEIGIPYDPEQARAYLAEAGYPDGEGFPAVTLWVYQRSEKAPSSYYRISVDTVAQMWQEVLGVNVTVTSVSQFINKLRSGPPNMYLIGWGADYVDPENFLGDLFSTSAEFNFGGYSNSTFDQLVNKASTSHDKLNKQNLYIQAERILCEEDAATIPVFYSMFFVE